ASDMTSVQAHGNRWRVGGVPARKAPLVVLYRYPARGLKRAGPGDLQAVELGSVRTRVSQEQRSAGRTAFALPGEDAVDARRTAQRRAQRHGHQGDAAGDGMDPFEHLPTAEVGPEERLRRAERLEVIVRCLRRLDDAWLRYVEDLPERDIATRVGASRDAVAT